MEKYSYKVFSQHKHHKKNLVKLMKFLVELKPEKFHMKYFSVDTKGRSDFEPTDKGATACGTVACAAGNGPRAGIKVKADEDWFKYIERVFGVGNVFTGAFDWAFGANWASFDNTPVGAAKRIYLMVTRGIPQYSSFSYYTREEVVKWYSKKITKKMIREYEIV